ncbi:WYL domain-containing protein [Oceaniovalibus sp. ACAM 378]|uniref:WYL domain-containing protein n=1 Tax=Oceaniovalibus sp. ACAM 378 TaxID=2599923 RepID=UPI0011D7A5F5|nr:WYL domain-containing protein [Oceaniovalibus sp. ACAM 378]TYB89572.1 WYL domain-containing protein [Oceaniovalibus sp. ACAM 378]
MEDLICKAIQRRTRISFMYKGVRCRVEPHLLGYDVKGNLTLSAWQLPGRKDEGLRHFHISEMAGIASGLIKFPGPRPGYNPNDQTIPRVVCRLGLYLVT